MSAEAPAAHTAQEPGVTQPAERHSSEGSSGSPNEKEGENQLETIHTNERVDSHTNYYEKGGLRTEGDGVDHVGAHQKLGSRFWLAFLALSFVWSGSQIPLYLFGGITPDIYGDIGGVDRWIWLVISYLIALAALCPFTGAMSDMIGRRWVAVIGQVLIIIGTVVISTAKVMNVVIAGMTLAGAGAGMNELTSLAGTGELVPTAKRGQYVGLMVLTIVPWCPSVLYAQAIVKAANWRYVGILCGVWNFIGLIAVIAFYFPPPRLNTEGYGTRKILSRIDYIGGLFSISGVLLFLMALQWGATQYPWGSAHVIAPLVLGIIFMICFCFWEAYGAKYPMVPTRLLRQDPRVMALTLFITFLSGANFIALLFFWPTQAYNVYGSEPIGIGIRGLPIGFAIIGGAVICLIMIGVTRGRIRILMVVFSVIMTLGTGLMAYGEVYNLNAMYAILTIASIGVGGLVVPTAIIVTIITPDDLIATITALSLSIRILGGAVGFAAFYNVFYHKFVGLAETVVGQNTIALELLCFDYDTALAATFSAAYAEFDQLRLIIDTAPCFNDPITYNPNSYEIIVQATQSAFAQAYRWPYYISIAFGVACIISSALLGDIKKYMDDHVAVVLR